eukprot:m51a1_g5335 hypothetical protein (473) ;mRNA; r:410215-412107
MMEEHRVTSPLVDGEQPAPAYSPQPPAAPHFAPEPRRWYILAVFALVSCAQCLVCVPNEAMEFYGMDQAELDLLLNWGSLVYVPLALPVAWVLGTRGLRPAVLLGSSLVFACAALRAVPCPLGPRARHALRPLLHAAQALNGAAAPVVLSPVSLLAAAWFPERQRATATAVAVTSNGCGMPVAFLLGPALVRSARHFPRLVYAEAAAAFVPFALAWAHFPSAPRAPPSAAAAAAAAAAPEARKWRPFLGGIARCLRSPAAVLCVLATGTQSGVYFSFTGCLQQSLPQLGTAAVGWLGFASSLASIAGSLAGGRVVDRWLGRRMKAAAVGAMALCAALFLLFSLCAPSVFRSAPIVPENVYLMGVLLTLIGFIWGTINPVMYELAAEITFPVSEAISGGLITTWMSVAMLVTLFVVPKIPVMWFNLIVTAAFVLCAALAACIRDEYRRHDLEDKDSQSQAEEEVASPVETRAV